MPSRKKLQGQSRKAKRANATTKAPICACDHIDKGKNWSKSDADAANQLTAEYVSKFCVSLQADLLSMSVDDTYNKYHQFNDSRKELFRGIILASGVDACVRASSQRDLTLESSIPEALPFVCMMLEIEVRCKYNGVESDDSAAEFRKSLEDVACPRETVRFFHKRNHCDCLKEIYHNLKESTKRTARCWNCKKVVDIRKLSRCAGCNVAQYCSYDCAVAMWPEHKEQCKRYQTLP